MKRSEGSLEALVSVWTDGCLDGLSNAPSLIITQVLGSNFIFCVLFVLILCKIVQRFTVSRESPKTVISMSTVLTDGYGHMLFAYICAGVVLRFCF